MSVGAIVLILNTTMLLVVGAVSSVQSMMIYREVKNRAD